MDIYDNTIDEIASRIAAAKRSKNEDGHMTMGDVRKAIRAGHDNDNLPVSEWSPTIGQPEAANSGVPAGGPVKGGNFTFMVSDRGAQNYTTLRTILDAAFAHAATGKGKERHARDLPFDRQPMLETTRLVGPGFPLGQAIKKAGEAAGMIERGRYDAAEAECLGAINYLAGAVAWMREQREKGRAEYGTGYIPPAPACAGAAA